MADSNTGAGIAQLKEMFFSYLDDQVTAASVESVLQILLRTEGEVHLTAEQVAQICHQWAQKTLQKHGTPVFQSLATGLYRIYQANALCSLPNFKLADFIRPFVNSLFRLCPADERDLLKEELPLAKERFERSIRVEEKKQMPEFEVQFKVDDQTTVTEGEWLRLTGEKFQAALEPLQQITADESISAEERLRQIQNLMPRIKDSFQNVIDNPVLTQRLSKLILPGTKLFNRGELEAATLLFGLTDGIVTERNDQFLEKAVASTLRLDELDKSIIDEVMDNPERKKLLKAVFANIFDTRQQTLVSRLAQEENPEERKKILKYLTVYEPEIFTYILQELTCSTPSKWYFQRNLVFLLRKVNPPEGVTAADVQHVLQDFIHPDVHPTLMQEAVRSYLFFDPIRGAEFLIRLLRAPHVSEVIRLDHFYPVERLNVFNRSIMQAAASFNFAGYPAAVKLIVQTIEQEIGRSGFKMGKFGISQDQRRVDSLLYLLSSSNSPDVVHTLQSLAARHNISALHQTVQRVLSIMRGERSEFI
ncbi:MAG: hypothetical protein JXQ27_05950 [Acidobacteria bacterium]|nr:hypothetical protein [Acidobacteriota bacterium]